MPQFAQRRRPSPALRMEELEAREVPATLYGVTNTNALLRFDSATPSAITTVGTITGIGAQQVQGIDFRPATGQLYAIAQAGAVAQLYTVNASTAAATPVGAAFNFPGTTSEISFDPVADNIRLVLTDSTNRRIDPTTGALLPINTPINSGNDFVIAYDRHFPGTTQTTLFAYDFTANALVTIGSANGTPNSADTGLRTLVGGSGIVAGAVATTGLTVGADGTLFLNAVVGGTSSLFSVNPATGAATKLGDFTGGTVIGNIAAPIGAPEPILVGGTTNGSAAVFTPATNAAAITATYTAGTAATPFGGLGSNVRTATGDVNGDGVQDFILVTGPGVPIRVAVLSGAAGNAVLVAPFDPFPPGAGESPFMNGGFVSAGDMDGDGRAEFAVSPDTAGGPRVTIYSFTNNALATRANFFTVDPGLRGGARTAIGDLNGDGFGDLAVGAGFGGGPRVQLLNGLMAIKGFPGQPQAGDKLIADFFAFDSNLRDGSYIAIGDVNGDGIQDLIFGPGDGGPLQVLVVSAKQFLADGSLTSPLARFTPTGLGGDGSGARVSTVRTGAGSQVNVVVGAGKNQAGASKVYPGASFTNGMTTEPTGGMVLTNGGALADGIFVG